MSHADRIITDHLESSGLVYIEENRPGILRKKCGRGFRYCLPSGETLKDPGLKKRLQKIAVPPSYTDVWYCPDSNGHIQATGYDGNGKKQYFYHEEWEALREKVKFDMLSVFAEKLPLFRRRIDHILKNPASDRDYVLAGMARILDRTGMRIGNAAASQANSTYGLTTLTKKHVTLDDENLEIDYKAKGGIDIHTGISDWKIAQVIDYCADIPGQRLFKYKDEKGETHKIGSQDFNLFLKEKMGADFTAKDFRTWRFSVYFLEELLNAGEDITLKSLLSSVAQKSGNTPSVLQNSYIHPALLACVKDRDGSRIDIKARLSGLYKNEAILLSCLKKCGLS